MIHVQMNVDREGNEDRDLYVDIHSQCAINMLSDLHNYLIPLLLKITDKMEMMDVMSTAMNQHLDLTGCKHLMDALNEMVQELSEEEAEAVCVHSMNEEQKNAMQEKADAREH